MGSSASPSSGVSGGSIRRTNRSRSRCPAFRMASAFAVTPASFNGGLEKRLSLRVPHAARAGQARRAARALHGGTAGRNRIRNSTCAGLPRSARAHAPVTAYSLTARCALTGWSANNERIRERGGRKVARNVEPALERPRNALSRRSTRSGRNRKSLRIHAISNGPRSGRGDARRPRGADHPREPSRFPATLREFRPPGETPRTGPSRTPLPALSRGVPAPRLLPDRARAHRTRLWGRIRSRSGRRWAGCRRN